MAFDEQTQKHLSWLSSHSGLLVRSVTAAQVADFLPPGCLQHHDIAEVHQLTDGSHHDEDLLEYCVNTDRTLVCVTDTQFGIYRSRWFRGPRFLCELNTIQQIRISNPHRVLTVQTTRHPDLISLQFESKKKLKAFARELTTARARFLSPQSCHQLNQLSTQMSRPADERLQTVSEAIALEPFHPALRLLAAMLAAENGRQQELAQRLLETLQLESVNVNQLPWTIWELLSDVRLSNADVIRLTELLDLSSLSQKSQPGQWLLAASLHAQRREWAQSAVALNTVYQMLTVAERPQFLALAARLFGSWKTALQKSGIELPWLQTAESQTAHPETGDTRLQPQQLERDREAAVHDYWQRNSPLAIGVAAWNALRNNRPEMAMQYLPQPMSFWKQLQGCCLPLDVRFLQAALAAVEIGLRKKQKTPQKILAQAFTACNPFAADCSDPLYQLLGQLRGLYEGLAEQKHSKIELYADLLQNDLPWVQTVISELSTCSAAKDSQREFQSITDLAPFQQWVNSAVRNGDLGSDADLNRQAWVLEQELQNPRLRVIVGGETSSGKSTFINRLLGVDVLKPHRQEATAVPTHITSANEWEATVFFKSDRQQVHETFVDAVNPIAAVQEFMARWTFLGSEDSHDVRRVELRGPLEGLPEQFELIDSPGLNAHQDRTELADEAFDSAHACVFVFDARNALKAGEMERIVLNQNVVSRTLFILNKIDLIESGSEFDVDDDPLGDLIAHVTSELQAQHPGSDITLFSVSSLNGGSDFSEIRERLVSTVTSGKESLLLHRARRLSRQLAATSIQRSMGSMHRCETQLAAMVAALPEDPTSIRKHLAPRVEARWNQESDTFQTNVGKALEKAARKLQKNLQTGLTQAEGVEDATKFLRASFRREVNTLAANAETARNREWERFAKLVFSDISDYFGKLYRDIDFHYEIDLQSLLSNAHPLPLPTTNSLFSDVDEAVGQISSGVSGGALFGAIVGGLMGGPAGAAIGAGLMGAAGGATATQEAREKISNLASSACLQYIVQVGKSLDRDVTTDGRKQPPLLQLFLQLIDDEGRRFERRVKERIAELKQQQEILQEEADGYERLAVEARHWCNRLEPREPGRGSDATAMSA